MLIVLVDIPFFDHLGEELFVCDGSGLGLFNDLLRVLVGIIDNRDRLVFQAQRDPRSLRGNLSECNWHMAPYKAVSRLVTVTFCALPHVASSTTVNSHSSANTPLSSLNGFGLLTLTAISCW